MKVEGHHIKIERIDSVIGVVVDGNMIDHVSDYKITNSAGRRFISPAIFYVEVKENV